MLGLASDLHQEIKDSLLACGDFSSPDKVLFLFTNERIQHFAPSLRQSLAGESPQTHVNTLIAHLYQQNHPKSLDNGLALYLQVLANEQDAQTACQKQLRELAYRLSVDVTHLLEPADLLMQMNKKLSYSQLKDLCLILDLDHENLPGESKIDQIRELILYMQRRSKLATLVKQYVKFLFSSGY